MTHPVLNQGMYGIMSADAPRGRPLVEGGHHALMLKLATLGLPHEEVQGHYGGPERSVIIHNASADTMKQLGKDFGQESVIHSMGGNHRLHFVNGPRRGQHDEGRGMEFFKKPPEDYYTELPGHGFFRLHFQQGPSHPHAYDWHDPHTSHYGQPDEEPVSKAMGNDQFAASGQAPEYKEFASHYGKLGGGPTSLKYYPYQGKGPDVENLLRKHGYQAYYAGGQHGKPDLARKNYNTKHLMIYDPEAGSGGDFGEREYTDNWRKVHELAHALTYPELNAKYGEGRRIGKLGYQRTPHEAMRAVHWEWLAAHKQRELSKDLGVHVSDDDFNRELNTVMHDAAHRAVTGKFTDPQQEGFTPHGHKIPLTSALALVAGHAQRLGLHPHDTLKVKQGPPPQSDTQSNQVSEDSKSMADEKTAKSYTAEEVAAQLMKAAREKIAGFAVEIEALRKREGVLPAPSGHAAANRALQKSIIPVHDHKQGLTAAGAAEDIPPGKLTEKAENPAAAHAQAKVTRAKKLDTDTKFKAASAQKAEKCMKCGDMHQPMAKCGLVRKDQPSPDVRVDDKLPPGDKSQDSELTQIQKHERVHTTCKNQEYCWGRDEARKADFRKSQLDARFPAMKKTEDPTFGVTLAKGEKCLNPGCKNPKTGTKYCSRACSIAVEDPKLHEKLKSDWAKRGTKKDEPAASNGKQITTDALTDAGDQGKQITTKFKNPAGDNGKQDTTGFDNPAGDNGEQITSDSNGPEGHLVTGKPVFNEFGDNGKQIQQAIKTEKETLSKPPVSQAQRGAMRAAAAGESTIGISRKVGKDFSNADPGGKLPEHKKSMPEGISPALAEKLQKNYGKAKALTIAWRIHDELKKNNTNQFFNNGADSVASAGTTPASPANTLATSASNQPGVQAGGAGDNMPAGEGNVLNKAFHAIPGNRLKGLKKSAETFVDNQGHVVETGIDPDAVLPPKAPSKARSRGVVPQRVEKNGQELRAGEKNGSGGLVLPGASLKRPGRTAGKKGAGSAGDAGFQDRGDIKEPSQEGFGKDKGPIGNGKQIEQAGGEGSRAPNAGGGPGKTPDGKNTGGKWVPSPATSQGDQITTGFAKSELWKAERKRLCSSKDGKHSCLRSSGHSGKHLAMSGQRAGKIKEWGSSKGVLAAEVSGSHSGGIPVKKAVPGAAAVPTAKPPKMGAAPGASATSAPKMPAMPKPGMAKMAPPPPPAAAMGPGMSKAGMMPAMPKMPGAKGPVGPKAGGVGVSIGGTGGGASGGKSEPKPRTGLGFKTDPKSQSLMVKKPASKETQAWMNSPSKPAKPVADYSMAKGLPAKLGAAALTAGALLTGAAVKPQAQHFAQAGMQAQAPQLPGAHLEPGNPAPPKNTAPAGPLKVAAQPKPGIFGKIGSKSLKPGVGHP